MSFHKTVDETRHRLVDQRFFLPLEDRTAVFVRPEVAVYKDPGFLRGRWRAAGVHRITIDMTAAQPVRVRNKQENAGAHPVSKCAHANVNTAPV